MIAAAQVTKQRASGSNSNSRPLHEYLRTTYAEYSVVAATERRIMNATLAARPICIINSGFESSSDSSASLSGACHRPHTKLHESTCRSGFSPSLKVGKLRNFT